MGIKSAAQGSWFPKAAVLCILLALLLHLIGMGAPYWARTNPRLTQRDEHIGLWRYCSKPFGSSSSVCDDFINIITGDWLKAAQSFSILGLVALLASVALTIVYAFVPDMEGEIKVLGGTIASLGVTVGFLLLSIGTFAGRYDEYFIKKEPLTYRPGSADLYWGFGIDAAGTALCILSFFFMLAEAVYYSRN